MIRVSSVKERCFYSAIAMDLLNVPASSMLNSCSRKSLCSGSGKKIAIIFSLQNAQADFHADQSDNNDSRTDPRHATQSDRAGQT